MNIAAIDLSALPSLLLSERAALPDTPAIYFALADDGTVLYIGKARRLSERWKSTNHHRYAQLSAMGNIRLAWLSIDDEALLDAVEVSCIDHFSPPLNRSTIPPSDRNMLPNAPQLKIKEVAEQKGIVDAAKLSREAKIAYDTARRLWSGDPGSEGDKGPGLLTLWKIAQALGVKVSDLYEEDDILAPAIGVAWNPHRSLATAEVAGFIRRFSPNYTVTVQE